MNNFFVLIEKELRENLRNFKFLWIPLVFVLLGVSDPLTNYYMKDILAAVGNLPEGYEMLIPEFTPADLLQASMGQFQIIGLIVLIATFAGSISRERKNGTATLLYVRPISYASYFMSKWVVASLVAIISVVAGFAGSVYYTNILYGSVDFGSLTSMVGTYIVWALLVITVTLTMSAAFSTTVSTVCSFGLILGGMIIDSLVGTFWPISPYKLASYGMQFLYDGPDMQHFWMTFLSAIVILVIFIVIGIVKSKTNAATTKI